MLAVIVVHRDLASGPGRIQDNSLVNARDGLALCGGFGEKYGFAYHILLCFRSAFTDTDILSCKFTTVQ
jgi:hypothetical protein